jgi:4-amino-4-deoxy-L-arabinose transferase-like glycosyltransferase
MMLFPRAIQPGIAMPIGLRSRRIAIPRAALALVVIAALAAIPHAINMWSYPAFSIADDEGIYASQAIAWLHTGALSPYTYSYDHAPGGWIQLAIFYALTGGPATFGTPIDGGRVFMLILHVGSALLLYRLVRLLGGSVLAGVLAVTVMTVSPLAVFYQRRVLLDTIRVFWQLLALVLAIDGRSRAWLALSGVAFAIALLS